MISVFPYVSASKTGGASAAGARQSVFAQSRSNVFIKNLPFSISDEQFRALFSRFGTIKSLRIKKPDVAIRHPGLTNAYAIAYVEYEKQEESEAAIKEMNGYLFNSHILSVEQFVKTQQDHINITVQDVVDQEYLKALFIKGIDRKVCFRILIQRGLIVRRAFLINMIGSPFNIFSTADLLNINS